MTRTEEPVAVLTDDDHGKVVTLIRSQHLPECRIADEQRGNSIGVEDHRHASGSIRSNSLAISESTASISSRCA